MRWFRRDRHTSPPPSSSPEIVPVVTAANQMDADLLRGILEAHRIPAMTRPGGIGAGYIVALQPHDILVRADDLDRARDVLAAFRDDDSVKLLWR